MDCKQSGVNNLAVQNQRIILPSARDVMQDVLALHAHATRQCTCSDLEWLVIDVRDAFYQLPLHPLERKYAVAKLVAPSGDEHYYTFLRLPMG
eukprot:4078529-Amphidinium_carterae.1